MSMIVYAGENLSKLMDGSEGLLRMPAAFRDTHTLVLSGMSPTYHRGDVLVYAQDHNKVFAYVGVLRDAWRKDAKTLCWRYYEPFHEPFVVCDADRGIDKGWAYAPCKGFASDAQTLEWRSLARILEEAEGPVWYARAFAASLAHWFASTPDVLDKAWKADRDSTFQKGFDQDVGEHLAAFCAEHDLDRKQHVQTEGLVGRGRDGKTYGVLGTTAWPDSAVLSPFRCAIEYDHQGRTTSASELKTSIGKTAAHVLSGAYPVAVHVFFLRRDSELTVERLTQGDSIEDRVRTDTFLQQLEQLGLYVAIVGPTECT